MNTLITLQEETGKNSIVSTNDEINDKKRTSKEIPSHQNSAELIDHTCDDNRINLLST